ncbi:unnamed protein product, partial [Urochloa humidicola]
CHGEQEGGDVQVPNQVMQRSSSTPRMLMDLASAMEKTGVKLGKASYQELFQ